MDKRRKILKSRRGRGSGVDPVFYALDDVNGTFSADVIVGSGALTEGRTSTIYLPDENGIWQSFGSGVPGEVYANGKWWLYGAPAATNVFTYSSDFRNTADAGEARPWVYTGTSVAVLDEVGLTGAANTATTLTDNAATHEYATATTAVADDSNPATWRAFIKKDNDETRFIEIDCRFSGGTGKQDTLGLNTKTGASAIRVSSGSPTIEVNSAGDWWECLLEMDNNGTGNNSTLSLLLPAMGSTLGASDATTTGSMIVGQFELHQNKTIAQVRGTSPLFTAGSTTTINATDLSFDDANHNDTQGAYFCEFKNVGFVGTNVGGLIGLGTNGRLLYTSNASKFNAFDGANSPTASAITLAADDVEYDIGLAYGSDLMNINTDDDWGTEAVYDGEWNNAESKLNVLHFNDLAGAPTTPMLIRNIRRYDLPYDEAQDEIDELMG